MNSFIKVAVVLILTNMSVFCIHGVNAEAPVKVVEDCWKKETAQEKVSCFLSRSDLKDEGKQIIYNVIKAESGFRNIQSEIITNGVREDSHGVCQIHLPSHNITKEQAYNIEFCVNFMTDKYKEGKMNIWTEYRKLYENK